MFNNKLWQNSAYALMHWLRRYHFIIIASLIILLFALEGFFLYHYFYKALTQTKTLAELKQQSALIEFKMPIFEKLIKFHAEKQQKRVIDWDKLRDPFVPTAPPENKSP